MRTISVRGGSSGATSALVRRRTKGRSSAGQRLRAGASSPNFSMGTA